MRKLLRVSDVGPAPRRPAMHGFRRSMLISTVRCTLTYLVFPFALPALGLVTGVGLALGLVIGVLAITCDVLAIRRFFEADHRWRWQFSTVAFGVACLLSVLVIQDVISIVR